MNDNVSHPSHYAESCSIECIDAMIAAFGYDYMYHYCIINAFKYIWRHRNKNGLEDVKKADWYLKKADELYVIMYDSIISKEDIYRVLLKMTHDAFCEYAEETDPNEDLKDKIKEEIRQTNERIMESKEYKECDENLPDYLM